MLGCKVLIVDDDPEMVTLVGAWLRADDCEVVTAGDAMGAVAQALREEPDAIVLDLGLPAGGGHIALERLKRNPRTSGIPVVVLTASPLRSDHVRADELGASVVMQKEGDKSDLLLAVRKAVDSGQVSDCFPTG